MNILTFDIEEWYVDKVTLGDYAGRYKEYDYYLDQILDTLDQQGYKGTFFCLGGMATEFPRVIKKIDSKGHEIGCHSFNHAWLNSMTEEEVYRDTHESIDALEQCIGKRVTSYRAPAFSIGRDNRYVFEILAECGITRDASIFPTERDFGGYPEFGNKKPTCAYYNNVCMKEFPISTARILGRELAYSGGGYFRFFPLSFVKREMAMSDYTMTYFHIYDLVPESSEMMSKAEFERYFKMSGTFTNRLLRHIKSNVGKKGAFKKFLKLIETEKFVNLEQADKMIDWNNAPTVVL